jgi:predicted ATPase/DNA-binding XRE family transcriptional regulator
MVAHEEPGQFGALLQRHRTAAGLSQEELAERAGLSARGISDLERGKRRAPHPATLRRLAEALSLGDMDRTQLLAAAHPTGGSTVASDAVRANGDARHNLPLHLTSFIGRVQETSDIRRELAKTRLLTLTGFGGVGKTRLALHVAEQELETYRDGVWLVELAALREPTLVPQVVASVFNVHENPQEPLITTLSRRLQRLELLLILDNCEHVLDACVDLAHGLLRACAHLVVLTTTREVLGLGGETIWRVPPLRIASPGASPAPERVAETESAALFVDRARSVQPGFAVTPRNVAPLLEVCRRLDGIPLAIELAASRANVLSVEQINERLAIHFRLLVSRDPTSVQRHKTLDNTIRWSYNLLTPQERRLFDQLSVFAGGWSIEAMEAVAGGDGTAPDDLLDLLDHLIVKSLVLLDESPGGPPRYRMLEPLRQFGQERLRERREAAATHESHAVFFLGLFEQSWAAFYKVGSFAGGHRGDLDNLRTALRWLIGQRDAERAQRLAGASGVDWGAAPAEGRRWLEETLALDPHDGPNDENAEEPATTAFAAPDANPLSDDGADRLSDRARVFWSISLLAGLQFDVGAVEKAACRSLELYRRLGDAGGAAMALFQLGRAAQLRGDFGKARELLEETLALLEKSRLSENVPPVVLDVPPQIYLAEIASEEGNLAESQQRAEKALRLAQTTGFPVMICAASTILGELHYEQGRPDVARLIWEEALAREPEPARRHYYVIPILLDLARLARDHGDKDAARLLLAEALTIADELSRWRLAHKLEATSEVAVDENQPESALLLAGAAAALRDALGTPQWPTERARLDPVLVRAGQMLSTAAAEAAWNRGSTMPVDQAAALALEFLKQLTMAQPGALA